MIAGENVRWSVGSRTIVHDVTLSAQPGRLTGLLGPNGSGKSSLLRLLVGLRTPDAGLTTVHGQALGNFAARELARLVAFVDQTPSAHDDYRVRQVVELGRAPHLGRWQGLGEHDQHLVDTAVDTLGLRELANHRWSQLSGGEQQRTHIARALAQDTPVIVLDEPLNHLDIRHQLALLDALKNLATQGRTVLLTCHDLNLAMRWCDEVGVLSEGRLVQFGSPENCLTPALVKRVFGVHASRERASDGSAFLVLGR